jgi:hypothetical protein
LFQIFGDARSVQRELFWNSEVRQSRWFQFVSIPRGWDGHSDILTIILEVKMDFFGGFTLVKWESRMSNGKKWNNNNSLKADDNLNSCHFTLKDPLNLPLKIFSLTAEVKHQTIRCYFEWDSHFIDISVFDNCNAHTFSVIRWLHIWLRTVD